MSATLRLPHEATRAGERRLLFFTGLGPIAFLTIASVVGAVAPAYDPVSQTISDLVFTPLGWVQTLNFYLFGAATIGFGVALARVLGGKAARTSRVFLAVSGISLIAAGVFPAVVEGGEPTPSMVVHGVAFFFTFLPLPGAYAFAALRLRDDRTLRGFASYTAALPSFVFFLFALFGVLGSEPGAPLVAISGLLQRILVLVAFSWMTFTSVRLNRAFRSQAFSILRTP